MSSKVIKWFIRQASIRRPEKNDKSSTSKEPDEKKKFNFPRVSLRRRKGKPSKMQSEQEVASPNKSPSPVFDRKVTPPSSTESSPSKSFSDYSSSSPISEDITVINVPIDGDTLNNDKIEPKLESESLDSTSDSDTFISSVFGEYDLRANEVHKENSHKENNNLEPQGNGCESTKISPENVNVKSLPKAVDENENDEISPKTKLDEAKSSNSIEPHSEDDSKTDDNISKNENIAVFDEDGDISATTPSSDEIEPFTFPKAPSPAPPEVKPLLGILRKEERPKSLEKAKVKIVITQPSPERPKTVPPPLAPKPLIVVGVPVAKKAEPEEEYPDDLNPFGDEDESPAEDKKEVAGNPSEPKSLNPFGSDTEEEVSQPEKETKCSLSAPISDEKVSLNPFGEYDDLEDDGRLSPTNPFAGYEDVPPTGDTKETRPSLPPKSEARFRRGSVSSGPTPHPRRSKLHGSSSSLNSTSSGPVPYPRTMVPSSSSGDIDDEDSFRRGSRERSTVHRESLPDMPQELKRDPARGSLPPMSRVRYPRKKRAAPLPPSAQLPPSGHIVPRSRSVSISPDTRPSKNAPPRPPPPKKSIGADFVIKEKFIRKI